MADENSSNFRFDADKQEPESFYHEELKDLRVEKLSQRVTLLTILLPCLLAVAVYFGYQDLSGRSSRSRDALALEIQRLTKELEEQSKNFNQKLITFSTTLSTQDKDFGTSIDGRLFAMDKKIGKLQNSFKSLGENLKRDLKLNQDTIEKLKVSKVDKKSQAVAIEKTNASITTLEQELLELKTFEQDLQLVSKSLAQLEKNWADKLKTLSDDSQQHGKNYEQLQASMTKLFNDASNISKNSIDKDAMALEVFKLKKHFQNEIAIAISSINQRLDTIQSEVIDFETISGTQKQSLKRLSRDPVSQQSGAASETGADSTATPVQSGTITEKDLIE